MTADSGRWLVYGGEAFDIWQPDTGNHFASADADKITGHLQTKRLRQHKTSSSAFAGLPYEVIQDAATLPCRKPRIAFRDITNGHSDSRTVIAALVPGRGRLGQPSSPICCSSRAPHATRRTCSGCCRR